MRTRYLVYLALFLFLVAVIAALIVNGSIVLDGTALHLNAIPVAVFFGDADNTQMRDSLESLGVITEHYPDMHSAVDAPALQRQPTGYYTLRCSDGSSQVLLLWTDILSHFHALEDVCEFGMLTNFVTEDPLTYYTSP